MVLGVTLICVQGLFSLVLLIVLGRELCAKAYAAHGGNIKRWETIVIFVCEVADILLEITLVVFFTHINFDYDAHRTRKIDADGAGEYVEGLEENGWTASYIAFLAVNLVSVGVDIGEIYATYDTLKDRT